MRHLSRRKCKKNRRTRRQRGGVSNNIKELLMNTTSLNNTSNLTKIKKIMKTYIASPWDAIDKHIMNTSEYNGYVDNYKKLVGTNLNTKSLCQSKINASNKRYPYQMRICQSHSGNLFEHSQWSALQIIKWFNDNDPIINHVDMKTAIVAAFFHDVGKGGDCIQSCKKEVCWLNMYADAKYNHGGDSIHPSYRSDMILGLKPFRIKCNGSCNANCEINIKTVLEKTFPSININEVALAAEMHWEFGKLNIPGKEESEKINTYLSNFKLACQKCGVKPSETLLRLCIAVACADITAGTNRRLLPNVNGIIPANEEFIGKDPWVIFGMEAKYLEYQEKVLAAYKLLHQD